MAATVEKRAPEIQRKTAMAVLNRVVLGTPVGQPAIWKRPQNKRPGYVGGRARANWFTSVGMPILSAAMELHDGSGSQAIQRGQSVVDSAKGDSIIYITNNLPYIKRLNDGWSKQAPAGFVEMGVQNGIDAVRGEKIGI